MGSIRGLQERQNAPGAASLEIVRLWARDQWVPARRLQQMPALATWSPLRLRWRLSIYLWPKSLDHLVLSLIGRLRQEIIPGRTGVHPFGPDHGMQEQICWFVACAALKAFVLDNTTVDNSKLTLSLTKKGTYGYQIYWLSAPHQPPNPYFWVSTTKLPGILLLRQDRRASPTWQPGGLEMSNPILNSIMVSLNRMGPPASSGDARRTSPRNTTDAHR